MTGGGGVVGGRVTSVVVVSDRWRGRGRGRGWAKWTWEHQDVLMVLGIGGIMIPVGGVIDPVANTRFVILVARVAQSVVVLSHRA